MRRKNLAEGIEELWKRRKTTEEASRIHDFTKQRYYQNARNAPRRDDEIFTDISIPASVLQTNVPRDPLRFQRALESKARTEAILARKSQDRKDAIQKLYMTARSFIVDEKALEKEVDKVFRPDTFSSGSTATGLRPENAWDLYGHPTTVQEMMRDLLRSDTKATSAYQEESSRTSKRQAKIAGELTGGPMDD